MNLNKPADEKLYREIAANLVCIRHLCYDKVLEDLGLDPLNYDLTKVVVTRIQIEESLKHVQDVVRVRMVVACCSYFNAKV